MAIMPRTDVPPGCSDTSHHAICFHSFFFVFFSSSSSSSFFPPVTWQHFPQQVKPTLGADWIVLIKMWWRNSSMKYFSITHPRHTFHLCAVFFFFWLAGRWENYRHLGWSPSSCCFERGDVRSNWGAFKLRPGCQLIGGSFPDPCVSVCVNVGFIIWVTSKSVSNAKVTKNAGSICRSIH